jgi:hypothetical protein
VRRASRQPVKPSRPVYWPRDLVPSSVPSARILTFGYDTRIRHVFSSPGSRSTLYDIAWDFLVALEGVRRSYAQESRPIIFVAHSLGGIVVKELLRRSAGCLGYQSHLKQISESTVGIMFFGTPHSGADPRGWIQHIAERIIKATGFTVNEQIVNTLFPSSERLRELRDEFKPIASRIGWIIYSFQEDHGVPLLGGKKVITSSQPSFSYLSDYVIIFSSADIINRWWKIRRPVSTICPLRQPYTLAGIIWTCAGSLASETSSTTRLIKRWSTS